MNVPIRSLTPASPPPLDDVEPSADVEPEAPPAIDLHQLGALLRRNLPLIAAAIAIALVLGLLVTVLTVPRYLATARIQVEQQTEKVLRDEDEAPGMAQDAERFLQTQVDVMKSRSVAIGVAQSLRLFGDAHFHAAMGAGTGNGDAIERERVIGLLTENLDVDLPRNSRVMALTFGARDPRVAADVANAFANVFIAANLQRKFASSAYAREFLAGQLVEAKTRLERSERDLNAYSRAAGLIAARPALGGGTRDGDAATTTSQSVTTASLQQLNTALNAARAGRIEAQERWRTAAATPLMSLPDVLASSAVQNLLQQRATVTAELREARERYRADFPALKEKAGQLDEVNRQIGDLASDIRRSIRNRYEVAQRQERSLAASVAGMRAATLDEQD